MRRALISLVIIATAIAAGYIVYSYNKTEQTNAAIRQQIAAVGNEAKPPPPPPPPQQRTRRKDGETVVETPVTPIEQYERDRQINIELVGVLKLQINENNSWETIAKLLVLILMSYGGIKYINKRFA